jgi:hypothetical protein
VTTVIVQTKFASQPLNRRQRVMYRFDAGRVKTTPTTATRRPFSRRTLAVSAALLAGLAAAASMVPTVASAQSSNDKYTVGLIGDFNYGPINGPMWKESDRMIADINNAKPSFVIHNGDIKGGSTECTDEIVLANKTQFRTVDVPLVYLFGDNEWTDCYRALATVPRTPFGDPLERLDYLRQTFYASNESQGATQLTFTRQADVDKQFQTYVENIRWVKGPVMYVAMNVPGSNNNCPGGRRQVTKVPSMFECRLREPAVLKWLSASFDEAKKQNLRGVVIAIQANPDFENRNADLPTYDNDGYKRLIKTLQNEVATFSGEVVLTHGDSHLQKIDQPLTDIIDVRDGTEQGKVIGSFRRVETFGNPETHWIRMTVDPAQKSMFGFERMIVAGNPTPRPVPAGR